MKMKKSVQAAIAIFVVFFAFMCAVTIKSNTVYADTDAGSATTNKSDNEVANVINDVVFADNSDSQPQVSPKDPSTKPDNGLMNLDEMYEYEPHISKDEDEINLEELPPEELLEELDKIFVPSYSDEEPAIKAETVISAIEEINNKRIEDALSNAGQVTHPDVGESLYEKAVVVEKTDIEESNGITSISDTNTSNDNVVISSKPYEENEKVATKTVARVYRPDGTSYEMELTTGDYNSIPLNGTDGEYVINIYQCNGSGYTHVSQHVVEKETEQPVRTSSRSNTRDVVETAPSTEVKAPVIVASEPKTNDESPAIVETVETPVVTDETPVVESEPELVSVPVEEEDSFNETETSMTMDELMGMLGGF